jgi:hypothetical protein
VIQNHSEVKDFISQDIHELLVALILAIIQFVYFLIRRHKIIWCSTGNSSVEIGNQRINTYTVAIQNVGWRDAKDVHVIHNWRRGGWGFSLSPLRSLWTTFEMPGGQVAFAIKVIPRGETVFITYVYFTRPFETPILDSISIDGRATEQSQFPLARRHGKWVHFLWGFLAFLGSWVVLYALLKGVAAAWKFLIR